MMSMIYMMFYIKAEGEIRLRGRICILLHDDTHLVDAICIFDHFKNTLGNYIASND